MVTAFATHSNLDIRRYFGNGASPKVTTHRSGHLSTIPNGRRNKNFGVTVPLKGPTGSEFFSTYGNRSIEEVDTRRMKETGGPYDAPVRR